MSENVVEVTESCRCGSSMTVKGAPIEVAADKINAWRAGHRCLGPDEQPKAPEKSGAGAIIGFQSKPWDFDRGPVFE